MINKVEDLLLDYGYDGVIYFTNPSYERAFLEYQQMIEQFMILILWSNHLWKKKE